MKVNSGKCHILLSTKIAIDVHLEGACITLSSCEKLGITIDSHLKFDKHISDLCDKFSKKINALCRVTDMSLDKGRIVMKTFVDSQFNYCPLIWMLHARTLNNKINRLHERALRIVYSDSKSFNTLLGYINTLCRVTDMSLDKRRIVMKTFVDSQFNYCPLIWMLHARTLNNKINRLHERALRIVYSDSKSFNTLLEKDGSFSIHHSNIQSLAIEIYKFLHGLSPAIMGDIIKLNRPPTYNLRTCQELYSGKPKTVRYCSTKYKKLHLSFII